ncbi:MAG: hypothetical protein RIR34_731 [Actinomycetota bacterium]|jgi:hypothetical protein
MKRAVIGLSAFILTGILTFGLSAPAVAGDAYVTQPAGDGFAVASVEEAGAGGKNPQRAAYANVLSSGQFQSWLCSDGVNDSNCKPNEPNVDYQARQLLEPCVDAKSENCIESLSIISPDGTAHQAKLLETLPSNPALPAVPSQGLFESKGISLYQDDSVSPSAFYAVVFWNYLRYNASAGKWITTNIDASVYPYRVQLGSFSKNFVKDGIGVDNKPHLDDRSDPRCDWNDESRCGIRQDFAAGTRVKISARVAKTITGWFRGRITKPSISLTSFSEMNNAITVEGEEVNVPRMRAVLSPSTSTPEQQQAIINHGGNGGNTVFRNEVKYPFSNWGEFDWVEMFRGLANDTSAGLSTVWSFSTIDAAANNSCMADNSRVLGIVSTNATIFNGTTPTFENGMLSYKVAGMHYLPDGKNLSEGTYDLIMRSDVARCLYGFSKAPISATISVIGNNGESKTAVTTVGETDDGWLKLAAYGFTFSSPTIQVKLSQQDSQTTASSSAAKTAARSITCVKGKVTKKVTGTSPKCPAGFKKK